MFGVLDSGWSYDRVTSLVLAQLPGSLDFVPVGKKFTTVHVTLTELLSTSVLMSPDKFNAMG